MIRIAVTILLIVAWHFPTTFFVPQDIPNERGWLIWPFGRASAPVFDGLQGTIAPASPAALGSPTLVMVAAGLAFDRLRRRDRRSVGHRRPIDMDAAGSRHRRRQLDDALPDLPEPAVHRAIARQPRRPVGRLRGGLDSRNRWVSRDSPRKERVMKVLVTAASRHGSTAEIASIIAGILQASDIDAETVPPEAVASVADYDAVILGSAVYAGQWLEPARAFVARTPTISRHDRSSCSRAARWAIHRVIRWSRPTPSPSRRRPAPWTSRSFRVG